MVISADSKLVLIDDENFHLDYLKGRATDLGIDPAQIETFNHPREMPSLAELADSQRKQIAILSDAHHSNSAEIDIDIALLAKLMKEKDQLADIDTRLGFRSSDIGLIASDNAPRKTYSPASPQRLNAEVLSQLHQRRENNSDRRTFYTALANSKNLRSFYLLMTKFDRNKAVEDIDPSDIDKDNAALELLMYQA